MTVEEDFQFEEGKGARGTQRELGSGQLAPESRRRRYFLVYLLNKGVLAANPLSVLFKVSKTAERFDMDNTELPILSLDGDDADDDRAQLAPQIFDLPPMSCRGSFLASRPAH